MKSSYLLLSVGRLRKGRAGKTLSMLTVSPKGTHAIPRPHSTGTINGGALRWCRYWVTSRDPSSGDELVRYPAADAALVLVFAAVRGCR